MSHGGRWEGRWSGGGEEGGRWGEEGEGYSMKQGAVPWRGLMCSSINGYSCTLCYSTGVSVNG